MARYIKDCECAKVISEKFNIPLGDVIDVVYDISTADVVEVVRCRKCKYGDVSVHSRTKDGQEEIACYCNLKKAVTDVDGYCSSGERRGA